MAEVTTWTTLRRWALFGIVLLMATVELGLCDDPPDGGWRIENTRITAPAGR